MEEQGYQLAITDQLSSIDSEAWDACANPVLDGQPQYNPFISHAFLSSLEESECAIAETGWLGQHILLYDKNQLNDKDQLIGALPCYLKSHSQGEYVFDHGWADAFERAGGRYYPKLQCSIPFTPATGSRLLVRPGPDQDAHRIVLLDALKSVSSQLNISSAHITFLPENERNIAYQQGFLRRTNQQFHWANESYDDFDQFLQNLVSRKRKVIKRERRDAQQEGLHIQWLIGSDILEHHWDAFFAFYMDTGMRKWGHPYLNRQFFSLIHEKMKEKIALCLAKSGEEYIAGALNFIGSDTLFGRYWGTTRPMPFLHFELCYYQAIDFAISQGLSYVEAGAQGPHKLARGYRPVTTYSAHWITHAGLRNAIREYLDFERLDVAEQNHLLDQMNPFRQK